MDIQVSREVFESTQRIHSTRKLYISDSFAVELEQTVYALDTAIIDLCLNVFPWARFRQAKVAVKTQIWIAIAVYVLVAIVKKRLNTEASLHTILQILNLILFEKTPLD